MIEDAVAQVVEVHYKYNGYFYGKIEHLVRVCHLGKVRSFIETWVDPGRRWSLTCDFARQNWGLKSYGAWPVNYIPSK